MNARWKVVATRNQWGTFHWWAVSPAGAEYLFMSQHQAFRFAVHAARGRVSA